jgi:hypothetical protein
MSSMEGNWVPSWWEKMSSWFRKPGWFLAPLHWCGYQEEMGSGIVLQEVLGAAMAGLLHCLHSAGTVVKHYPWSSLLHSQVWCYLAGDWAKQGPTRNILIHFKSMPPVDLRTSHLFKVLPPNTSTTEDQASNTWTLKVHPDHSNWLHSALLYPPGLFQIIFQLIGFYGPLIHWDLCDPKYGLPNWAIMMPFSSSLWHVLTAPA